MIRSFRNRALRRFMERGDARRIRPEHRDTVRDILTRLNASAAPDDMDLPGFRLHPLKGELAGFWAVTVRRELAHRLPLRGRPRARRRLSRLPLERQDRCSCTIRPTPAHSSAASASSPWALTVTEAAKGLAVSRNTLSMLNGRLGISPEMAIRLSQAFGGSPESWLQQQLQYDLWHAQQGREKVPVRRFVAA